LSTRPYLLDTSVTLHLARGKDLGKYIDQTFGLSSAVYRPLISIVSHGELWLIADRNGWGTAKCQALSKILSNLVTIDINDQSVLDAYIAARGHSESIGRVLSNNDHWIAACTKAADAILLTTDDYFVHLHPSFCLVTYIDPKSQLPGPTGGTQTPLSDSIQ
jgi:predicted nucleic acid-binding protein